jgi:hypothetical protein
MRKLVAIVVLLCGAVSVSAATAPAKWCVKYTEDGVSLIKAPGTIYKLKLVGVHTEGTEESTVWATDDRSLSVGLAENDAYWFRGEKAGELIVDCP